LPKFDSSHNSEICRNDDYGGEGEGSNGGDNKETRAGILMQTVQSQGRDDEDACWEECTSKEGADAEYCEGKLLSLSIGLRMKSTKTDTFQFLPSP